MRSRSWRSMVFVELLVALVIGFLIAAVFVSLGAWAIGFGYWGY